MAGLPDDLKYMVVDYITLPSDLRSLCLVSKSWYTPAAKRLHASTTLEVHSSEVLMLIGRALQAGLDLRRIRSLTLFENYNRERITNVDNYDRERDYRVDFILNTLPSDTLSTFRFITNGKPLGYQSLTHLLRKQTKLEHLSTSVDRASPVLTVSRELFFSWVDALETVNLKTFNVLFHSERIPKKILFVAIDSFSNIKRLLLQQPSKEALRRWSQRDSYEKLVALRELVLLEVNLGLLTFSILHTFIDFKLLERLVLWKCYSHRLADCLHQLGAEFCAHGKAALQHFAADIRIPSYNVPQPVTSTDHPLVGIYKACPQLRSLYLGWGAGESSFYMPSETHCLPSHLKSSLEQLSLHGHFPADTPGYSDWFSSYTNLRQLGIQLNGHQRWRVLNNPLQCDLFSFLDQLPELRTLFIGDWGQRMPRQQLATSLFNAIHESGFCPNLKVIAFRRREGNPTHPEWLGRVQNHDRFFVKSTGTIEPEGAQPLVAISVPLPWLRDQYADLDILDYDPKMYVKDGWPAWHRDE